MYEKGMGDALVWLNKKKQEVDIHHYLELKTPVLAYLVQADAASRNRT